MARLGVTYQDIANAADQILGQGRQPTIELIRNLLGTGSTTTIANHLRKWRAEQDGSTSVTLKENLPQEFVSMMKGLWQRLQAHADNQIVVVKQEADQRYVRIQQDVEKYKANNQRWQKMHDAWVKEKAELSREKLGVEQAMLSVQKDNAGLVAKLDAQQNQLSEKQQRIDELNRLHKLAQENLEHYRESARVQRLVDQEKHAQQLQQAELSLKVAEQQLFKINQDKQQLQQHFDKLSSDQITFHQSHDNLNYQYAELKKEHGQLEKHLHESKRDAHHWKQQCDSLQKKIDHQNSVLVEHQTQNATLSQQVAIIREEVNELKIQNKLLAHEKWEIAQEKAQLEGINKQMQTMLNAREVA